MSNLFKWDGACLITGWVFKANDVQHADAKKAAKKKKAKTKRNEITTTA